MFDLMRAGPNRRRGVRLALLLGAAAALVLVFAAAGRSTSAAGGGTLTFLSSTDVGSLDPGRVCAEFDYMVVAPVSRSVFYYKPGSLTETPDLASGPAKISNGGKTITIHIRPNVHYAPPVNRAVTSQDIRYGIERLFTKNVASCYATIYFGDLVDAPTNYGPYRQIKGIETPNKTTIVFHLKHPTSAGFLGALAMPGAVAVPKEYAQKFDKNNPSTYEQHVAATGPYMNKSYKPGVSIVMVRNPNWNPKTDFRPAKLDQITISEGNSDLSIAAQRALNGTSLACCDQSLPGPVLKTASQKGSQFHSQSAGGVYFMTLNYKFKPLDNVNVRKALSAIMDRNSFLLTLGGKFAADPATGFIPKGVPGWTPTEGSQFDFVKNLNGDAAVAKKYMLLAKKQGVPVNGDGKYTGNANLTVMGINTDPASKAPLLVQSALGQLGIKSTVKLVSNEAYNSKLCYFTNLVPAICSWNSCYKDFPDEIGIDSIFAKSAGLAGVAIPDPKIQAAVNQAIDTPAGPQRNAAWQHVDGLVTATAKSIPFAFVKTTTVTSKNVVGAQLNPLYSGAGFDLTYASLK